MSKKAVTLLIAVIMLAMAIIIAMVLREPVAPVTPTRAGHMVSGTLEPSAPALSLLKKLPPPEAFVMSASEKPLTETRVEESPQPQLPDGPAKVISDSPSGQAAVTQPPAENTVPIPLPETPAPAEPPMSSLPPAAAPQPAQPMPEPGTLATAPATPLRDPQLNETVRVEGSVPPPAESQSAAAPATAQEDEKKPPRVLTTSASLPAGNGNIVLSSTLVMDGDVVTLRLQGNKALSAKGFLLSAPDRVVFDLPGNWKVGVPRVPSNRMVRSLRSGEQGNATRLVFDMRVKPAKATVKQVNSKTVELIIR